MGCEKRSKEQEDFVVFEDTDSNDANFEIQVRPRARQPTTKARHTTSSHGTGITIKDAPKSHLSLGIQPEVIKARGR